MLNAGFQNKSKGVCQLKHAVFKIVKEMPLASDLDLAIGRFHQLP